MQAPSEVWERIISHFRIYLSKDKNDTVRAKKRTLLALALTHPKLADIALDEHWKSMLSLQPIVNVVSHKDNDSSYDLKMDDKTHCWLLSHIPNADTKHIRSRTSHFLARIQSIRLNSLTKAEYMLWQALSTLGLGGPLCPNLRELRIDIRDISLQDAYQIAPLLTSSLRCIALHDFPYKPCNPTACIIFDTLRFRNADILDIFYEGNMNDHILERAMSFPNLNSVSLPASEYIIKNPITPFLRNLTTLELNLDCFCDDEILPKLGKWFETLVSLTSLTLHGRLENIHKCIHDLSPMTSIYSFGLYRRLSSKAQIKLVDLIPLFVIIFPNLYSLLLKDGIISTPEVTLNDLMSFRERPMRALDLIFCSELTENDIAEIVRTWPTLERLWIEGSNLSARYILPLISCSAPSLRDLALPVDFPLKSLTEQRRYLMESPLEFPHIWGQPNEVVCPLHHLEISSLERDMDFCQTLGYARKLIELFPRLRVFSARTARWKDRLPDLHVAINILQDTISFPPRRLDRLFI